MVKAIIFDAGGVILSSEKAYEILAKKIGISKPEFDKVKNKYVHAAQRGEISTDYFLSKLSLDFNVDKHKLRNAFEQSSKFMVADAKVLKIVDSLKENGYKTAMITNTAGFYRKFIREKEVYRKFSPLIASYEVGVRKPEEKIYKIALKRLNLKADECVFIDDREEHLAPAEKLGMKAILFKSAAQLKRDLKKLDIKL